MDRLHSMIIMVQPIIAASQRQLSNYNLLLGISGTLIIVCIVSMRFPDSNLIQIFNAISLCLSVSIITSEIDKTTPAYKASLVSFYFLVFARSLGTIMNRQKIQLKPSPDLRQPLSIPKPSISDFEHFELIGNQRLKTFVPRFLGSISSILDSKPIGNAKDDNVSEDTLVGLYKKMGADLLTEEIIIGESFNCKIHHQCILILYYAFDRIENFIMNTLNFLIPNSNKDKFQTHELLNSLLSSYKTIDIRDEIIETVKQECVQKAQVNSELRHLSDIPEFKNFIHDCVRIVWKMKVNNMPKNNYYIEKTLKPFKKGPVQIVRDKGTIKQVIDNKCVGDTDEYYLLWPLLYKKSLNDTTPPECLQGYVLKIKN